MKFYLKLLISTTCLLFVSCKKDPKLSLKAPKTIKTNKSLKLELTDKNNNTIDSVHYFIDEEFILSTSEQNTDINIQNKKLGKRNISALVFMGEISKKRSKTVTFLAPESPKLLNYRIVNTYPHSNKAYTQGLEIHNGELYESTGLRGKSSLRKLDLKTGEVLLEKKIDNKFFGEGMTLINDRIYMLTWQSKKGFIYNPETFEELGSFDYNKSLQGWGLTNDGHHIIKSDGTEKIWFLNPNTQEEESYIEVYTDKRKVQNINELEYINGKIYANIYLEDTVIIIEPTTGQIESILNLKKLRQEVMKTQSLKPRDEVLNGIAFDKENNKLYVTGKNWDKLFEIEILEQ